MLAYLIYLFFLILFLAGLDDGVEKTPTKRVYRSTTTQVERALRLQQKQVDLLQRIVNQNEEMLKLMKEQNK